MRDDLAARVEALERKASVLRRWVTVLSAALVGACIAGASGPQELTLRRLTIVGDSGEPRIVADTRDDNSAVLELYDRDGEARIGAFIKTDGTAGLQLSDRRGGKAGIGLATTGGGGAGIAISDREGQARFGVIVQTNGASSIEVIDSRGHQTWVEKNE